MGMVNRNVTFVGGKKIFLNFPAIHLKMLKEKNLLVVLTVGTYIVGKFCEESI